MKRLSTSPVRDHRMFTRVAASTKRINVFRNSYRGGIRL